MRSLRNVGVLIGLANFATSPATYAQDFKKAAEDTAVKWNEAFNKKDAGQVAKLYGPNAALLPPESPAVVGEQNILQFWTTNFGEGFSQHTVTVQQAEAKGDMGYTYGRWQATGPGEGGADTLYEGSWSNVLERQGGQWKIVLHAWN